MGAWGVKVLENDYTCDEMIEFLEDGTSLESVVYSGLHGDEFQQLLSVALIDSAVNGFVANSLGTSSREYADFFKQAKKRDLAKYVPDAVEVLNNLIADGATGWRDPEERLKIYQYYLDRLTNKSSSKKPRAPRKKGATKDPGISGGMNPSQQEVEDFFNGASTSISKKSSTVQASSYAGYSGYTVNQLFNACMVQMNKGNGDKEVYISRDDEGNGYHKLFYGFTDNPDDLREIDSFCGDLEGDYENKVILG